MVLTATFPEVTLELACVAEAPGCEVLIVPMAVLEEVGGATDDLVELDGTGMLKGAARWTERDKTQTRPFDLILPGKQHDPLGRPQELKPVDARFLMALNEAGRTSSREDGRFALSRVQVRGAKGQVIATDGKVAVLFSQFAFPFADDLLLPAVPLFGCAELRDETDVRVGRTAKHLVVSAGDWTAWLSPTPSGKFPDVAAVVPRHAPTTVTLDRSDTAVLPRLPDLPGQSHEHRPVTLDAEKLLTVCGYDETTHDAKDITLARSQVTGPKCRVVLDRRSLARILALGCTTLRLTPEKALVGLGEGVTVLVAPLDPQQAAPAKDTTTKALVPATPASATHPIPDPHPERTAPMKPPNTNGSAPSGRRDSPSEEPLDPLTAAEELREALGDVLAKVTRLIASLRATRKEKKVLSNIWAGLKQLNLAPGNGNGGGT